MELHAARRDVEKRCNVLHCFTLRYPCKALPFPLRQRGARLIGQRGSSNPGAHMRMVGQADHLQEILGGLNETVESKAPVIHRQRERCGLSIAAGNPNRQTCPDLETERIVKQTAFSGGFRRSRSSSVPWKHSAWG